MGWDGTSLNGVTGEYKKFDKMGKVAKEGWDGGGKFLKWKSIKKN